MYSYKITTKIVKQENYENGSYTEFLLIIYLIQKRDIKFERKILIDSITPYSCQLSKKCHNDNANGKQKMVLELLFNIYKCKCVLHMIM